MPTAIEFDFETKQERMIPPEAIPSAFINGRCCWIDLDIADRAAVHRVVADARPALIFNCAVLQVDESEKNPARAHSINAAGPGYLAEAATEAGAEVVQFSTQYAFGGEPIGRAPYTSDDQPRPVNVYGQTKVAGEQAVREACERILKAKGAWRV